MGGLFFYSPAFWPAICARLSISAVFLSLRRTQVCFKFSSQVRARPTTPIRWLSWGIRCVCRAARPVPPANSSFTEVLSFSVLTLLRMFLCIELVPKHEPTQTAHHWMWAQSAATLFRPQTLHTLNNSVWTVKLWLTWKQKQNQWVSISMIRYFLFLLLLSATALMLRCYL